MRLHLLRQEFDIRRGRGGLLCCYDLAPGRPGGNDGRLGNKGKNALFLVDQRGILRRGALGQYVIIAQALLQALSKTRDIPLHTLD
jgi:hypothetical protein